MIKKLVIENFLSFQKTQEINLQPLTVVIGANNSGKSNLISAFRFLSFGTQFSYIDSARQLGRILGSLSNRHSNGEFRLAAQTENELAEVKFQITDSQNPNRTPIPLVTTSTINNSFVVNQLLRIRYFKFSSAILIKPSPIAPKPNLGEDGSGLASVLDFLRGEHPDVYDKIEDDFKRFVPEVERIQLRTVEQSQKVVLLKQRGFKEPFPANEISDGLLLFLALLCCVNTQPAPSMICLDEPDNGIHPRRLRALLDQLRALTERPDNPVQILMTTHSPYMLDWFKDDLESVLILDRKDDEGTVFRTAKEALGPGGLNGSPLGDIWYSGQIGGVPA
jgi:predicted ATPase